MVQRSALCRFRRELANAYLAFLTKFGFDTAENEPSKVWPAAIEMMQYVQCSGRKVRLFASFHDDRRVCFLLEFVNGGELFTHLRGSALFLLRFVVAL